MMTKTYSSCNNFIEEMSSHDDDLLRFPQRALRFPHAGHIIIEQSLNDVGTTLWDSEILLAHHVDGLDMCGKRLLEIGAGTALCGIVAYRLGAAVCLQDLEDVLTHTANCLALNEAKAELFACKWGIDSGRFMISKYDRYDYIVMSDVLYNPENFDELLDTITTCSSSGTRILLVYEKRRLDLKSFFCSLSRYFVSESMTIYEVVNSHNSRKTEFHLHRLMSKK